MKHFTFALLAMLTGCSAVQPCITAHGPSVRLSDANGVLFSQQSQTLEFCPGYITPNIGGTAVPTEKKP